MNLKQMIKIDWEHLGIIFWMTVFGVISGFLLAMQKTIFIFLGIVCLLVDVFIEYRFMVKLDSRPEVEKTKNDLKKYVRDAKILNNDLLKTKKEIEKMQRAIFDPFSKNGFKTVEERIKNIEKELNKNNYNSQYSKLINDVDKIKKKLNIWP